MNKMFLLLAAGFGAAILTGCTDPVMDNRYYKDNGSTDTTVAPPPATEDAAKPEAVPQTQEVKDLPEAKPEVPAQPKAQKSVRTYEPMQQLDSDKITGINKNYTGAKKSAVPAAKGGVYTVKRGDTLGKIAYRNRVSVSALLAANNMEMKDAKRLRIGQKLTIPAPGTKVAVSKKSAKSAKAVAVKSESKKAVSKEAINADGTYTVKRGDSPERIARKLKVKLDDLLKANNLDEKSSRNLKIGQKLVVPNAGAVAAPVKEAETTTTTVETAAPAADTPQPAAAANQADALAAELEKTLQNDTTKAAAEVSKNNAETTATLADELYVVREAEISLADIAKNNNTSVEELKKLNPGISDVVTRNEVVNLPAKK